MLNWATEKKCSTIISSVTTKSTSKEVVGVASTGAARGKLVAAGIKIAEHATIPGIPGEPFLPAVRLSLERRTVRARGLTNVPPRRSF